MHIGWALSGWGTAMASSGNEDHLVRRSSRLAWETPSFDVLLFRATASSPGTLGDSTISNAVFGSPPPPVSPPPLQKGGLAGDAGYTEQFS